MRKTQTKEYEETLDTITHSATFAVPHFRVVLLFIRPFSLYTFYDVYTYFGRL